MSVPIKPAGTALSFRYGDERIPFLRVARPSSSGRVLIKVHPDCRVIVAAPEGASNNEVLLAVKKRSRWVYEKLRGFREQLQYSNPRKYVSGESHYYLGKQYLLKVTEDPESVQGVKLMRGKLEVSIRTKSSEKVKALLNDWYKERAKKVFNKRMESLLEQALWVTERPQLRIQAMTTQWGSCSPNGRITLNPHLVKAPRQCIDYVILHELCHIAEHNHSERFYKLMGKTLPDWRKHKETLDRGVSRYIPG